MTSDRLAGWGPLTPPGPTLPPSRERGEDRWRLPSGNAGFLGIK